MWCNHTQKWCDDRFFPPHTLIRLNRFSRILPGSMMQVKWKEKRTQTRTNPQKPESLCCYLLLSVVSVVDVLRWKGVKKVRLSPPSSSEGGRSVVTRITFSLNGGFYNDGRCKNCDAVTPHTITMFWLANILQSLSIYFLDLPLLTNTMTIFFLFWFCWISRMHSQG